MANPKNKKRKPIIGIKEARNSELRRFRGYPDEIEVLNKLRAYRNKLIDLGQNPDHSPYGWLKEDKKGNLTVSAMIKNPYHNAGLSEESIEKTIDSIIEKHSGLQKRDFKRRKIKTERAIKVTITDSHVGMNPNPNKEALFQYEYNRDIFNNSMNKVFDSILKEHSTYGVFDLLLLDDLGDLADGWDGYTTRGGHQLPQNLSNAEVFEACVDAKVNLVSKIVDANVCNKVILRCVVNDNHSGDFSLIINKAIQKIVNLLYDNTVVEVDILTRFIEHRVYGNHCFLLTHGKDSKHMKGGLPIVLNDKTIKFITDYINHYNINSDYIHLEKGDLHQIGYQKTKLFDYRNYMSFAPSSSWVQHNFGDGYSGYSIQVVPKFINEISHTDYFLEYKKKDSF